MSELYNRIETLCKQRGINVTQMCKECGASRASLGSLKQGRNESLSSSTLSKIANYFGVTVGYLLGQEDEKALKIESLQHFAEDEPTDEAYQQIKKFILNANQDELDETLRYIQFIKSQRK